MTKRAPDDPRGYSNRAAALIKLMAFPQAVQDCDEAIKRDPNFIRAYVRKSQALLAMKEYNKALDALTAASEHDTNNAHTREIEQQQQKVFDAQYAARAGETEEETAKRIQNDPEVSRLKSIFLQIPPGFDRESVANGFSRSCPSSKIQSCRASCSRPRATRQLCRST